MAKSELHPWTAAEIVSDLEACHPSGQWTFVANVPNGTGGAKSRTCDALAMGCWRSVGVHLHGYEIKISRGDWLREIQDPLKALAFSQHCHFWWIVAPEGVVNLDELSAHWGLKVVKKNADGSSTVRVKRAATINPNPSLDYDFLAAVMRKCKQADTAEAEVLRRIEAARNQAAIDARSMQDRHSKSDSERKSLELQRLQKAVEEFEAASGISINMWNGKRIGTAAKYVMDHGSPLDAMTRFAKAVRDISTKLDSELKTLESENSECQSTP